MTAKAVPLTLFTVVELCKEANIPIDLEQLVFLVQEYTLGVNQPQATIQTSEHPRLGFFRLSTRIAHSQWEKVLSAVADKTKQPKLVLHEELNKNGKHICFVSAPNGKVLGYLSGYLPETLEAIHSGIAIIENGEPCSDVSEWLDF